MGKRIKALVNELIRDNSGQALILVLVFLLLGSLMIVPLLSFMGTGLQTNQIYEFKAQELYAADAGMGDAILKIQEGSDGLPGPFDYPLLYSIANVNDRQVSVTIIYVDDAVTYKVTAIATSDDGSSTTIESYVSMTTSAGAFEYGIVALGGDITLSGNAEVGSSPDLFEGNVHANGDISLSGNAEVQGDATATGEISTGGNSEILGDQVEDAQPLDATSVDTQQYLQEAEFGGIHEGTLSISGNGYYDLGPLYITGNLSISGNRRVRLGGTVYVDGTINMSGNTRIEGPWTIVAQGSIALTGNTKLDVDDMPFVMSTGGDITITGNNWTSAVVYAVNGDVTLAGNSKVYGSVIGQSVTATGNNTVEYCTTLGTREDLPISSGGALQVLTWGIS